MRIEMGRNVFDGKRALRLRSKDIRIGKRRSQIDQIGSGDILQANRLNNLSPRNRNTPGVWNMGDPRRVVIAPIRSPWMPMFSLGKNCPNLPLDA